MAGEGAVDAVLMASGASARFGGEDKLLSSFRGKPLARHVLDLASALSREGSLARVFFVAACARVQALAGEGVTVLANSHPERGKCESIRLGVEASGAQYIMFFPCDQGLLDRETILAVLAARRPGAICRPVFAGVPGSPVLFSRLFRDELCALRPGESGRTVIAGHQECVINVAVPSPLPLLDFDTPEDLAEYERP